MTLNVTLAFFVLLVPLSGFIAWAGDRIGHKSGKRRHSLFGLRPRHTAMVFTIGSGMLTAVASFALFWLFSETFRIVVRDGGRLYETNVLLKHDNQAQVAALRREQDHVLKVRAESREAEAEKNKAVAQRSATLRALDAAEKERQRAETLAQTAQKQFATAQVGLQTARQALNSARENLTQVKGNLNRKTAQVAEAEQQVKQAQAQVTAANLSVTLVRREQQKAQKDAQLAREDVKAVRKSIIDFRNMNHTLNGENVTLIAQANEMKAQVKLSNEQFDALNDRTAELRDQFAALQRDKQRTQEEVRLLRSSAVALRSGRITYQVGEEVDRLSIRPGFSVWRVEAVLTAFLNDASKKAQALGAAPNPNGRAVVIPSRTYVDTDKGRERTPKIHTEDDEIRDCAADIRRYNEETVVVVTAAANAVAGETVAVRFQIFRNPVVLHADTKLGELSVNGDGPRQEVADRLYTFLNRDIHRKLIEGGIIPPLKGEDIVSNDLTRVTEPFKLSGDEWLSLMDDVRKAGPRAKVVVYPARDLRAGDTPALRFDVKHPLIQAPAFLRDIR